MPIRRGNYPKDWRTISRRRREQAGWRCEKCGAPDGVLLIRNPQDPADWIWQDESTGIYYHRSGRVVLDGDLPDDWKKPVRIQVQTAHRDQDPFNCAEENLAVWCQYCHLNHDRPHNIQKKAHRRALVRAIASGQLALRL